MMDIEIKISRIEIEEPYMNQITARIEGVDEDDLFEQISENVYFDDILDFILKNFEKADDNYKKELLSEIGEGFIKEFLGIGGDYD